MDKSALCEIMDADVMSARMGEGRTSRCDQGREIVVVEVVLGTEERMCSVEIQHSAQLIAWLPPFEARKQYF